MKVVMDQINFERFGQDKYKIVKEYGFDGVSYSMCNTNRPEYTAPIEESDELLLKERYRAEKDGVKFLNCHGPWRVPWPDGDPNGLAQKVEQTERAIHNTKVLGAKYCVIHPFLPMHYEINDPEKSAITWDTNIKILTRLVAVAKENDVVLCYENMPMHNFSLAKPRDIIRVIEAINDEHLMACFDTGHSNIYPELKIDDSMRVMAPKARVMHVHDNFYHVDMHLLPFCGSTDWLALGRTLKEVNYQYVFEHEFGLSNQLDLELSRDVLSIIQKTTDYIMNPEKYN